MSGDPRFGPPGGRHPTAIVDPGSRVAASAVLGPYTVIGPGVDIGEDVRLGPHVYVERDTRIGAGCEIGKGAALGADPQDLKYGGERSFLEIGDRTVIREGATLHRGTAASGRTVVGDDCLLMAYAHVAHDCRIGHHVVLANAVQMGGHVEIGDWAVVGGLTAVHQFVRIGTHAFVGGASRIVQDVPPYTMVAGNPASAYGINREGLARRSFPEDAIRRLERAWKRLFRSELHLGAATAVLASEDPRSAELERLLEFVRTSRRGVTRPRRPRRGTRA